MTKSNANNKYKDLLKDIKTTKTTKQPLGRGLSALLGHDSAMIKDAGDGAREDTLKKIDIDKIIVNPAQPRRHFDQDALNDLANSIKQKGILQPIVLREQSHDSYQIVAGERRYRAAKIAGLKEVPAIICSLSEIESLEVALIENIQREELNPMEEAQALKSLIYAFNHTHESLAQVIGKSRVYVTNHLRLTALPEEIQAKIASGEINAGHAKILMKVDDKISVVEEIIEKKLSVRDAEDLVRQTKDKVHDKVVNTPQQQEIKAFITQNFKNAKVKFAPNQKSATVTLSFDDLDQIIGYFQAKFNTNATQSDGLPKDSTKKD